MWPCLPQKAHFIIILVCGLIFSFASMIQNPQVYYYSYVRPHFLICRYDTKSSASRIRAYYLIEVKYNRKQVKILTTKSINDMPMLTCLLEFEIPKNSYLHHRSLKTQKMWVSPITKSLLYHHFQVQLHLLICRYNTKSSGLLSFLRVALFTHLYVCYRIFNIHDTRTLSCGG